MEDSSYSGKKRSNGERWYNSALGKGIGWGAIYFGFFAGVGCMFRGCDYQGSSDQTEFQRLRTIETLLDDADRSDIPLEDVNTFIKENNLDGNN